MLLRLALLILGYRPLLEVLSIGILYSRSGRIYDSPLSAAHPALSLVRLCLRRLENPYWVH